MLIQSLVDYRSIYYCDISWKHIFIESGIAVSTNKSPMGLVNGNNMIMVPDDFYHHDQIQLCFPGSAAQWIGQDIIHRSTSIAFLSGISFLKINKAKLSATDDNENDAYIIFLREILVRINSACKIIFKYTHDHLSNRYSDETPITKLSVIQSDFASLYLLLEKLSISLNDTACINDAVYSLSIAIEILSGLSILSGARSILRHRAVEFIFHLTLFRKFIGDDNN